jgi:hypothetical protein
MLNLVFCEHGEREGAGASPPSPISQEKKIIRWKKKIKKK